jgi:eukaryotic-like serine/threonine-protein kinase
MALTTGSHLGPYEIQSAIGTGGMGEVYRGHDTKLRRPVAIKVLLPAVADDPGRLARFRREAQVLASLNHPHIAQIYGLQESDGVTALVMELVEGPTLADLITSHPRGLPRDEALPIARQVAEALEAAHEQGVVHRDLKPANIKVRADGSAKVLDFGLAKSLDQAPGLGLQAASQLAESPTITSPAMTHAGVILGTAAYMSPEQARGKPVDKRADVWAFGCVLFEMLSGARAFTGAEVTDTLAAVLRSEPDWTRLPATTPASIRSLLTRCLEKDRAQRVSDIAVARFVLDSPETRTGSPSAHVVREKRAPWWWLTVGLAGIAIGAIVVGAVDRLMSRPPPITRAARFGVVTSPATTPGRTGGQPDIAISRDGSRIAYVNTSGAMVLRALDRLEAEPIRGLEGARGPFFSPDGKILGFFDREGSLKKIALDRGVASTISPAGTSRGAVWLDDDSIVFASPDPSTGLLRIPAAGGEPTTLTTPDKTKEIDHFWPHAVPGAHAVTFTRVRPVPQSPQAVLLDLDSGVMTTLLDGASDSRYLPSGHLVYLDAGPLNSTIRAVPFDLKAGRSIGTSIEVAQVNTAGPLSGNFDISTSGTLVFSTPGIVSTLRTLVWVDMQGHTEAIAAPPRAYFYPRISPDGKRLALDVRDQQSDIWIWEFARQTLTRVTTDPSVDRFPAWSPDGRSIFFTSERDGPANLYRQSVDSTAMPERVSPGSTAQAVMSVTPDGKAVIVRESAPNYDLTLLSLAGASQLKPLVTTPFLEQNGEVSPDGRWLAYESNESGQFQIYVRPFPNVEAGRWLVSSGGGTEPLWSRDNTRLYFLAPGGELMVTRVKAGAEWVADPPQRLPIVTNPGNPVGGSARSYDIGPDGRFLMVKILGAEDARRYNFVVVTNWFEELARLAPKK